MEFILKLTLQQMALVKIAGELWNHEEIWNSLKDMDSTKELIFSDTKWKRIENEVNQKVSHLPSPEPLKKDLKRIIRPIGELIYLWCIDLYCECLTLKVPVQFVWTSTGTINQKRTTKILIKSEDIDIITRYKLACINCLEDEIPELWNRIPEQQRLDFYNANIKTNKLVEFWSHQLVDQLSKLDEVIQRITGQSNPHVYAFYCAIFDGNLAATEFFFAKLSEEERNTLLVEYAGSVAQQHLYTCKTGKCYSEVIFFLLQRLSKDQEVQLLAKCPFGVLSCFLDWPHQPSFMDLAERIMSMQLNVNYDYAVLLQLIANNILNGYIDFDYRQLFLRFWHLSPLSHRRYVIKEQMSFIYVVFCLYEAGENVIIKMLFEITEAVDRHCLIVSHYVRVQKWEFIEFILQMCDPTKEVLVEVKDWFMKDYWCVRNDDKRELLRKEMFFYVLDELIEKKSKRENAGEDVNC